MTKSEFLTLCNKYLINPDIAIEDAKIREMLKSRTPVSQFEEYLKKNT